ncbi:MAG: integration host factor subunit alpha [Desulfobacterales bacterium]|nr:MAG: integration host factor subunit alpha [Desulfobacterales bacterium]
MTLTKAMIIDAIHNQLGFPKNTSAELLEIVLELVKSALERDEDVLISGFGKFCVKNKKSRRGRNPATGDDMTLEKRRVVTFRCSHLLREKINGK